ncbi:hypothetical protein [Hoeflea poritis]|uniref:Uncharacterized protein n=1 Tax=Hoeflea poritis TaxID=2993659 RepID=A0ABT4VVN5_9HYPH|nr:hypothetical protein [Hoeflea poritis]MDA4848756.1 hypothetical protein [Hoeflea poritis]
MANSVVSKFCAAGQPGGGLTLRACNQFAIARRTPVGGNRNMRARILQSENCNAEKVNKFNGAVSQLPRHWRLDKPLPYSAGKRASHRPPSRPVAAAMKLKVGKCRLQKRCLKD